MDPTRSNLVRKCDEKNTTNHKPIGTKPNIRKKADQRKAPAKNHTRVCMTAWKSHHVCTAAPEHLALAQAPATP